MKTVRWLLISMALSSSALVLADVVIPPTEQCLGFIEKYRDLTSTYKFVKSDSSLGYEIVEIPNSTKFGYVTYYTEKGYAEINPKSGVCNSSRDSKGKLKNASSKMLEIFAKAEANQKVIQAENDVISAKWDSKRSRENDTLVQFRKVCAESFPDISKYLEKNGTLEATKSTHAGCLTPNANGLCPPLR